MFAQSTLITLVSIFTDIGIFKTSHKTNLFMTQWAEIVDRFDLSAEVINDDWWYGLIGWAIVDDDYRYYLLDGLNDIFDTKKATGNNTVEFPECIRQFGIIRIGEINQWVAMIRRCFFQRIEDERIIGAGYARFDAAVEEITDSPGFLFVCRRIGDIGALGWDFI